MEVRVWFLQLWEEHTSSSSSPRKPGRCWRDWTVRLPGGTQGRPADGKHARGEGSPASRDGLEALERQLPKQSDVKLQRFFLPKRAMIRGATSVACVSMMSSSRRQVGCSDVRGCHNKGVFTVCCKRSPSERVCSMRPGWLPFVSLASHCKLRSS